MFNRFKSWLAGTAATPASPIERIEAIAAPSRAVTQQNTVEFWTALRAFASGKGKKKPSLSREVKSLRLPNPAPGVVPKGEKPSMAMDSQIADTYKFGVAGAWDGAGFMGYAYLAELTQIPEFRIPCEKIAADMTRKWGSIVSTSADGDKDKVAEKIKAITAEMDRLKVREHFNHAFALDQMFGRSQIWFDLGEDEGPELAMPLDLNLKIKKGGLKGLRVVEPIWTYPNKYNSNNPLRDDFYKPETWYVLGQEVHNSRFMTFISRPLPDILKPAYMFGGIALIQLMWVCVENWMRTRQSVSDLIHAFSVMVLQTDLAQVLTPEGATNLSMRVAAFNELRDNLGVMITSENESLTNVSAPLSGLSQLQAQSQEHMAAIATIPLIVLFGLDPAGLNATGDGQIRVYNQTIEGLQGLIGTPNMTRMLDIIQMSLFEEIDETLSWKWEPLWTMTAKEEADIRKTDADTDCALVDRGIIDQHEARARLAADPDSQYSSLDVDDVPELPDPQDEIDPGEDHDHDHNAMDAEFKEEDHPCAENGQFGNGGTSSTSSREVKPDKLMDAGHINTFNEVNDKGKFKTLVNSMEKNGWQGRPVIAYRDENNSVYALTGSHRIAAAKEAGIDVPVKFLSDDAINFEDSYGKFITDLRRDDDIKDFLDELGDEDAISIFKEEN